MREEISKRIDDLVQYTQLGDKSLNDEVSFVQESLYEALNSAQSFDTKDQLSSYIFEDKDPINKNQSSNISELESFVEKVRDIQNDILDEFTEFTFARGTDLSKEDD